MPLSQPARAEVSGLFLSDPLQVERVLYEADSPIVYLTRTGDGQLLLAYAADHTAQGEFTVLAPISESRLAALESGILSVRDALTASWMWLHLGANGGSRVWSTSAAEMTDSFLPRTGTPLLASQEPIIRTRAIGESLVPGFVPASVVAFVATSTRMAIKTLLDFRFSIQTEGRPREDHRTLYDLPVRQVAFASFELGFGSPDAGLFPTQEINDAVSMLESGLLWAGAADSQAALGASPEEREATLRAALLLTPPRSGPITAIDISGSGIRSRVVHVTRASRARIREELNQLDSERVFTYEGRLGELDQDNLSFILRDTADGAEFRGSFDIELLDAMATFFFNQKRVRLAGIERRGRLYASAVAVENDTPRDEGTS